MRIFIRQKPMIDVDGQLVHYDGTSPFNVHKVFGWNLSPDRYWGPWKDVTADCVGMDELQITYTIARNDDGDETPAIVNAEKKSTSKIEFYGESYQQIKAWLIDDVSAPLNAVEVKFYDDGCGAWLSGFFFDNTDLEFCEGDACYFSVSVRESENPYSCVATTLIADNWRGEFQSQPANGKKHPRFSYCNEIRPNGMLVLQWFHLSMWGTLMPVVLIIATIIMFIVDIIKAIIAAISWLFGGNPDWPDFAFKKDVWDPVLDAFGQWFVEAAGCGREHPAPLVRDYIKNVCDRCGLKVDGDSAPIFFSETIRVETASRGEIITRNPHYNVCLLTPFVKRGIRRFNSQRIVGQIPNNTDYYIPDNNPGWTLSELLDKLKATYNAHWFIKGRTLYFDRHDKFQTGEIVYNFKHGTADSAKIIEGPCYEWNEVEKPAVLRIDYPLESGDKPGNERGGYYSSRIRFGWPQDNPQYSTKKDIKIPFGGVGFRLDGSSEDYIYDAFQVVSNGGYLNIMVPTILFTAVKNYLFEFCDYAVLMQEETSPDAKLIIWDGLSYENAKAYAPHVAHDNAATDGDTIPAINPGYNLNGDRWQDIHHPVDRVRGASLGMVPTNPGYITVQDPLGVFEIKRKLRLMNYPLFTAPGFQNSLWDWFFWIDDPNRNRSLNMEWSVKIEKCCEDLERLGLVEGGQDIALTGKVLLPVKYLDTGMITSIMLNLNPDDEAGPHIEIKGTL